MSKADFFLVIGRAIITIYLIIIFVMVLAETIERSDNNVSEPTYYQESLQVLEYVAQNLKKNSLASVGVVNTGSTVSGSTNTLYQFSINGDWCSCVNTSTGNATTFPHFGKCSSNEESSSSLTCTTHDSTSINIDVWRAAYFQLTTTDATYPLNSSNTCSSSFYTYNANAGLCVRNTAKIVTSMKVVNETSTSSAQSNAWTSAGIVYRNATFDGVQTNVSLYTSTSESGSPYVGISASLGGAPCLNPQKTPSSNVTYNLTANSTGCGYWKSDNELYQKIDKHNAWNFFLDYDSTKNTKFFENLYLFNASARNESAYLYAERKLTVTATDFCYNFVKNPEVNSNVEDIPNLQAVREALCILGFVVSIVGLVIFIVYMIVTRFAKVSKESVGIYVFWLLHSLGVIFAVNALIVGGLTTDLLKTVEDDNAYLTEVSSAACFKNVPVFNNVYSYIANGISDLYSYIESYNTAGMVVAAIFILLELIILLWWLIGFSCHENLDEDDSEKKELAGRGPRSG